MPHELFVHIITQLQDLHFSGYLGLFSNNEPLLDNRICDLAAYSREMLPESNLYLYTNGTLLTIPLFEELMKPLDFIIIDNYTKTGELIKPIKKIYDLVRDNPIYDNRVTFNNIYQDAIRDLRGGNAPNRRSRFPFLLYAPCALPFRQLIIKPNGIIPLCCQDVSCKIVLGDASKTSLINIWNGEKYQVIRKRLKKMGRGYLPVCNECDFFYADTVG
jgi:MoaA/NifB/PqqE/SkfB family radical SAM enzyme